jgi:hypothetical protein
LKSEDGPTEVESVAMLAPIILIYGIRATPLTSAGF